MIVLDWIFGNWKLVLIGLAAAAIGGYVLHCEHVKKELAASVAIAEQQQIANAKAALRDMKNKERTDENYTRNIARINVDLERLRNASPSRLPTVAPGPAGTPTVTLDRPELSAALRDYREEVARSRTETRGLIGEGAAAIEGLDESKDWAARRD